MTINPIMAIPVAAIEISTASIDHVFMLLRLSSFRFEYYKAIAAPKSGLV
jgi:hypothetical protein